MNKTIQMSICLAAVLLAGCAGLDAQDKVFIVADTAYIDGHAVPKARYETAVANGTLQQLVNEVDGQAAAQKAAVAPLPVAAVPGQPSLAVPAGSHAAVCDTANAFDAYPGDNALFNCNAGLGALTRAQLLAQGWKVDMMEKTPLGKTSSRGLPLFTYKLVLSR